MLLSGSDGKMDPVALFTNQPSQAMKLKSLGIIPARYASTRFPGKPLAMIGNRSMICRVYEQVSGCSGLDGVIVATDDERIFRHVKEFGGEVMMTSDKHRSGTDRIGEVVQQLSETNTEPFDIIVNIQGDEPLLDPSQINLLLSCFTDPDVGIASLMKAISSRDELFNPNVVKVTTDRKSFALYFSRASIPHLRGVQEEDWLQKGTHFKHIGLYAFRTGILTEITKLEESPLETAESLEQLRWLEHGYRIKMVPTEYETIAIDTPEDLLKLTNNL